MNLLRKPVSTLVQQLSFGIGASTLAAAASAASTPQFDFPQECEFTRCSPGCVIAAGGVMPDDVAGFTQLQWGTRTTPGANRQGSLVAATYDNRLSVYPAAASVASHAA
jgi:hypothetical protein